MKKIEDPIVKVVKMQQVDIVTGSGGDPTGIGYENFQSGSGGQQVTSSSNWLKN